jgi:hypothetical protein
MINMKLACGSTSEIIKSIFILFKTAKRDIFVTTTRVLLIGREKLKQGPQKGLLVPVIKRDIPYKDIFRVSLSTRQVRAYEYDLQVAPKLRWKP